MMRNLKLLTKRDIFNDMQQLKVDIQSIINEKNEYLTSQFEDDASTLVEIFYNAAPYNIEQINDITKRIIPFLEFFKINSLINDVITALKLGYVHHIEHVTTSTMCKELGISKQAIQRYLFDINDPKNVEEARKKKHPMIPVQKYVRIVMLAERLDFDLFKKWYFDKRK